MNSKLSRYCDGIMEAAWLAAVVMAPVFFNVYSSRIFEPDKITLVRSLALLALTAWVVKLIEQGGWRWERIARPQNWLQAVRETPLVPLAGLTALIYILSTLVSVTPRISLLGSYQRLQGTYTTLSYLVLFLVMVVNLRRRQQVERIVTTIILASLPVALYGVLQRYKLDPIPWGGDTTQRVAANMGNAIFVAAYLIMAAPLTFMRIVGSFRAILHDSNLLPNMVRATLYVFIFALQLITIYFSFSRGPLLGLLAGGYLMALLLSLVWGKRWLTYSVIAVALLGASFFVVLNIPNGPLEGLRQSPAVGRFGQLLDTQSNTAKVRLYIWQGTVDLVAPHEPLQFPDGSQDSWNILRPLIGYGPEAMYVAYNRFYEPELGHVERRNASPDRAHNETWDSLVITGGLGFGAYMAIFLSFFYYGFSWLGLITGRSQKLLYWGLALAGGLVGAAAVIAWQGIAYLGVGLPFGVALGLLVYLAVAAISGRFATPITASEYERALILIALISAVMAHWLEINFGIAIVSTRVHFWVYAALLLLVGYILPKHAQYELGAGVAAAPLAALPEVEEPERAVRIKRRSKLPEKAWRPARKTESLWAGAIGGGFVLAFILISLGYSYITNSDRSTSTLAVLAQSFTTLQNQAGKASFGILALILTTWIVGALVWNAERDEAEKAPAFLPALGVSLGVAFGLTLVYLFWQAGSLAGLAALSPASLDELLQQVARLSGLLTNFYIFLLLLILGTAFFLEKKISLETRLSSGNGIWLAPVLLIVTLVMVYNTNLRVIHADVTFKMAEPFTRGDQWPIASALYNRALELAPNEDYYYLFLGRAYLEQAKSMEDETAQTQLVRQAEQDLKKAQKINPLNTDHTANLARLYSWWASQSSGQDRQDRAQVSTDFYEKALQLSPQNSTLWGEYAIAYMDLLQQPEEARRILEQSLTIDDRYNFTLGLLGDYYVRQARVMEGAERLSTLEQAADYYRRAAEASVRYDAAGKVGYIATLGNVYIEIARIDDVTYDPAVLLQAVQTFETALQSKPTAQELYRIEEQIARLYYQMNEPGTAMMHAQAALAAAPEAEKERLSQFVEALRASLP